LPSLTWRSLIQQKNLYTNTPVFINNPQIFFWKKVLLKMESFIEALWRVFISFRNKTNEHRVTDMGLVK